MKKFGFLVLFLVIFVSACEFLNFYPVWVDTVDISKYLSEEDIDDDTDKDGEFTLPAVTISSPTNGQEVGDMYSFIGSVIKGSFDIDTVMYSPDGVAFYDASLNENIWFADINLTEYGIYTNYVYATDISNNSSVTQSVWVTRSSGVPWVSIISHANGVTVNQSVIILSGNVGVGSPNLITNVSVRLDGADWETASFNQESWSIELTLNEGANTIIVRAYADSGEFAETAELVINYEEGAPTITITSHNNGEIVNTANITLSGTASVDGASITSVKVSTNGGATWEEAIGTTEWSINLTLEEGDNIIIVEVTADNGKSASSGDWIIEYQPSIPEIYITSHSDLDIVITDFIELSGYASIDNPYSIEKIEVNVNGTWQDVPITSGDYVEWDININLIDGNNTIVARAIGSNNKTNETDVLNITFDLQLPEPEIYITSPITGTFTNETSITIQGTAVVEEPHIITEIEVQVNGGAWQTANFTAGNDVNWEFVQNFGGDDEYQITARARVVDGAYVNSEPVTITIDTIHPTLDINFPGAGAEIINASYGFSGTASDSSGVKEVWVRFGGVGEFKKADLTGENWSTNFSVPRFGIELTNEVFAVDNAGNHSPTNTRLALSRYMVWEKLTITGDIFSARSGHTGVVVDIGTGEAIYIIGGQDGNLLNDVYYSYDGADWTELGATEVFSPRFGHSSIGFQNKIWVIGGVIEGTDNYTNDVWSRGNDPSWTYENNINFVNDWNAQASAFHSSVVFDNKIWAIGGESHNTEYAEPNHRIWYSSDGISWTEATDSPLSFGSARHSSLVFDNKLWIIGGEEDDGFGSLQLINNVYSSTDGENWTTHPAASIARHSHASVVYDNKMWVIGGNTGGANVNTVYWSTDGNNWYQINNAGFSGRSYHTAVVFDDGNGEAIYVIGGTAGGNEVWRGR